MKTLPELIIDGFDSEQVWAGVQLQNKAKFEKLSKQIGNLTKYVTDYNISVQNHEENKTSAAKGMVAKRREALNLLTGELIEDKDEDSDITDDEDDLCELTMEKWSDKKAETEIDKEIGKFYIIVFMKTFRNYGLAFMLLLFNNAQLSFYNNSSRG